MKKRIISLILIMVLAVGFMPTLSFAATSGDLTYEVVDGKVTITDCNTSVKSVTIPSQIDGYPVTAIGYEAFYQCSSLTSITIPDSVISIGSRAFCVCSSLVIVKIGNSLTTIGDYAFSDCSSLTSVTIPDSTTTIGDRAFSSCTALVTVKIPDSVTSIGAYAFRNCTNLVNVKLSNNLTSINEKTFYACNNLLSITIPDSVTSIGNSAFYSCNKLASVTIGEGVTYISDEAFRSCEALVGVAIPDSVTFIGKRVFSDCYDLADVIIGDGVISIGDYAFSNCNNLTSVTIGKGVATIGGGAFQSCRNISSVYYIGTEQDKTVIGIGTNNSYLQNATWHYCEYDYDTQRHFIRCTVCEDVFNSQNHIFNNKNTCDKCGFGKEAEHSWGEYVYNNDATTSADGTKTRTCSVCGESETVVAEGTKLPVTDPSVIPDDKLPEMVMNDAGNGAYIDMRSSWATRVYWGYIGSEDVEYKDFEEFRVMCDTSYTADFSPKNLEDYHFTQKGYYRFVLRCIISGDSTENYKYKDRVYTFCYDGASKVTVPYLKVIDSNTVQIEKNGLAVTKMYYGNIGEENVPYTWFNDFWGKSLANKSYKFDYGVTWGETYKLATKGFYNFVIVYNDAEGDSHEIVYTVEAKDNIGIITAENGVVTLNVDNMGGTVNKLYWNFIGDDATGVVDYETLKAACGGTLTGDWTMKTGRTYSLTQKGYYGFCVNYTTESYINGAFTNVNYDIIYIIDNN